MKNIFLVLAFCKKLKKKYTVSEKPMTKIQRIRDPLHNLIEFDTTDETDRIAWEIIQSKPFQRLRRIKQLGFSELTYPGATHTRFSHSIGVFHTARSLLKIVRNKTSQKQEKWEKAALIAALVHDVGHGPFSHAFEEFGKRFNLAPAKHEEVSKKLILDGEIATILKKVSEDLPKDVTNMITGDGPAGESVYRSIVSSKFDADRLDYMRRDRMMSGTQHSAIDFEWLLANLEIDDVPTGDGEKEDIKITTFVIGSKAIPTAEVYVTGLFQLYPIVYFHKATRGAEKIVTEIMDRIYTLTQDKRHAETGLPAEHPLIVFCSDPEKIDNIIALDDTVIWGSLSLMASNATDQLLENFAKRLLYRQLFKCKDIRIDVEKRVDPNHEREQDHKKEIDRLCLEIVSELEKLPKDNERGIPSLLIDQAERDAYKIKDGEGSSQSINVRTNDKKFIDLKHHSKAVRALDPYKITRVYYCDQESLNFVNETIQKALNKRITGGDSNE